MDEAADTRSGVRVLEFEGGVASAYAGWLLARMGAQVSRVTRAESLPVSAGSPVQLCLEALALGKMDVDRPSTGAALEAMLAGQDVLICDDAKALERLAGPLQALHERWPRLVLGMATIFGLDGPDAGYEGVELDAQALSSVAWALGEPGRAPLSLPPGIAAHQSGAMLAAGCLMALSMRDASGAGQVVDVALAEVLASQVAANCRVFIHHGLKWERTGRRSSGPYPFTILPCKDGRVCLFGRTRDEWGRLVRVMGDPEWASQPRYQALRAMGVEYPEEVDALLAPWLMRHTMAELEALALKNNLILSPVRDLAEVLETPQFVDNGFLAPAHMAGGDLRVPSLPFSAREARDPAMPDLAASLLIGPAPRPALADGHELGRPLAGLRVLDFGWVWSAPWVGTMLGELGAQVIKVEHALRPDNMRLSGKVFRDGVKVEGPSTEMSPMYHQINHGKLGITLNAKEPRAVELLKRLAGMSDLVIENMSPGSMERTGLGYNDLHPTNPRLVMLAMSAAGQFGALANMRAYAPTMSSFAGMENLVGYPGEAPIGALNVAIGDPNASIHALLAVLAALRRAKATGRGCYIDLSQIEALLGTLRPYLLERQLDGRTRAPTGNRHPDMAPHGIYPAEGTNSWLSVAVQTDAQWSALIALAPQQAWAQDPRFATREGRLADVADLDAAVGRWTATQPRDALVERLRKSGVAASPVLSIEQMWCDPHFSAREIKRPVNIPFYGPEDVFKAPWRFSDFKPTIDKPGPTTGQHNDFVFGELLGLSPAEIKELKTSGVAQ